MGASSDGILFDPTGGSLFAANRSGPGAYSLAIIDSSTGALVQHVPLSTEPDGIAFKASPPRFVVSGNTDGTMTRFDFPGDDYTQPPTQSVFASGGFRSDLSQVGSDGCLYQSQSGTRYDDGTTTGDNSLVRICPGFAPPAGVEGPPGALTCSNGIDDDGDGQTDQNDPDCQSPEGPPGDRAAPTASTTTATARPMRPIPAVRVDRRVIRCASDSRRRSSATERSPAPTTTT